MVGRAAEITLAVYSESGNRSCAVSAASSNSSSGGKSNVGAAESEIPINHKMESTRALIPPERIERAILLIRGQKVLLDRDLAKLYGVTTKALNQAVRRNLARFPDDFMF